MLRRKKENTTFSKTSTTVIAKGTVIKGHLHFQGNLDVSGTIAGNITALDEQSQLRVLPSGSITGEIEVPFVLINGRVEGDIHAFKHLEFSEKAKVNGSIHYTLIEIAKGAQVFGSFHQNVLPQASVKPAGKPVEPQKAVKTKDPLKALSTKTEQSSLDKDLFDGNVAKAAGS